MLRQLLVREFWPKSNSGKIALLLGGLCVVALFGLKAITWYSQSTRAELRTEAIQNYRVALEAFYEQRADQPSIWPDLVRVGREWSQYTDQIYTLNDGESAPRVQFDIRFALTRNAQEFAAIGSVTDESEYSTLGDADFETNQQFASDAMDALLSMGGAEILEAFASDAWNASNPRPFPFDLNDSVAGCESSAVWSMLRSLTSVETVRAGLALRSGDASGVELARHRIDALSEAAFFCTPGFLGQISAAQGQQLWREMVLDLLLHDEIHEQAAVVLLRSSPADAIQRELRGLDIREEVEVLMSTLLRMAPRSLMPQLGFAIRSDVQSAERITRARVATARSLLESVPWDDGQINVFHEYVLLGELNEDQGYLAPVLLDTLVTRAMKAQLQQSAMIVVLALQVQHGKSGVFPDTLTQLVPDILPELPMDPFSTGGIRYIVADDAQSFTLYSVGLDGVDDGGEHREGALTRFSAHGDSVLFPSPETSAGQ